MKTCELVVNTAPYHINQIILNIPFIFENLRFDKLTVITCQQVIDILKVIFPDRKINYINEDTIEDISKKKILDCLTKKHITPARVNWYYQQFLKMVYSRHTDKDFYVVWDADTIPLKTITWIKDGKYQLNRKTEHYIPYFHTLDTLFGHGTMSYETESYITEYMPFDKDIMNELIDTIQKRAEPGQEWYEKILMSVEDGNEIVFSEFETYGNYINTYHRDMYENIHIPTERLGMDKLKHIPTHDELTGLNLDAYTISFEARIPYLIRR